MSNHTVRFGPVCFFKEFHLIFIQLPSTAFFLYCHVLPQLGKRCYDCLREGDDTLFAAGNNLVDSSIKPWHVACALRRRREMVETITLEADERAATNSVRRNRGTRPAALHPRRTPARASPGASNWTCRSLLGYVVLLKALSIEHRTHCLEHSALRK